MSCVLKSLPKQEQLYVLQYTIIHIILKKLLKLLKDYSNTHNITLPFYAVFQNVLKHTNTKPCPTAFHKKTNKQKESTS